MLQFWGTQIHHKAVCFLCHRVQGSVGDLQLRLDPVLVFKVKVQPGDTGGGVTECGPISQQLIACSKVPERV